MNKDDVKKLIQEKMDEMPEYIQEAINSSGWEKKIFDIGRRHKLHIDDLDYLQMELAASLVGLSDQKSFGQSIKSTLDLGDEETGNIIEDINKEIFSHIREKLKAEVFEDEKEKYGESGLSSGEEKEMKKAGVSFGEEPETEPVTEQIKESPAVVLEKEEEFVKVPEVQQDANSLKVNISSKEVAGKPTTAENTLASASVFKTSVTKSGPADKEDDSFDPYREPVE